MNLKTILPIAALFAGAVYLFTRKKADGNGGNDTPTPSKVGLLAADGYTYTNIEPVFLRGLSYQLYYDKFPMMEGNLLLNWVYEDSALFFVGATIHISQFAVYSNYDKKLIGDIYNVGDITTTTDKTVPISYQYSVKGYGRTAAEIYASLVPVVKINGNWYYGRGMSKL